MTIVTAARVAEHWTVTGVIGAIFALAVVLVLVFLVTGRR